MAGFAIVHNDVADDDRLSAAQKLTYAALCRHAHADTAHASHTTLARTASLHASTIHRALHALRAFGVITWTEQIDPAGAHQPHTYTLLPLAQHYADRTHERERDREHDKDNRSGSEAAQPCIRTTSHTHERGSSTVLPPLWQNNTGVVAQCGEGGSTEPRGWWQETPTYIKEQDYTRQQDRNEARAPLPPSVVQLYTRLIGHAPKLAIQHVLAEYVATVGEMKVSAMMLDCHHTCGVITPASLITAQRKLERTRRGKIITVPPPDRHGPAALPDEPHPLWRAVLDELRHVVEPDSFRAGIGRTRVIAETADALTLAVPNAHLAHALRIKLATKVAHALAALGHPEIRIEYIVDTRAGENHA